MAPAAESAISEVDLGLGWDDALAVPGGTTALDTLGTGPVYAPRRTEPEPIQPMTMYAIWIGGGAVILLILLILGHITWKAFSPPDSGETLPSQPAETAPAEPAPAEPSPTTSEDDQSDA